MMDRIFSREFHASEGAGAWRVQARREVLGAAANLGVLRKPSQRERRHVACRDDREAVAARTSGAGAPLPP